jgi:anti-sigma factor RsiW
MKRMAIPKGELEELFVAAVDETLPEGDAARLKAELDGSPELKASFDKYQRAVKLLKGAPREKAPEAMASMVMRRVRRRRLFGQRGLHTMHMQYRVPVEVIIPILIGALVVAFIVMSAR